MQWINYNFNSGSVRRVLIVQWDKSGSRKSSTAHHYRLLPPFGGDVQFQAFLVLEFEVTVGL